MRDEQDDSSVTLAEHELQKRMEVLEELIDRLREIVGSYAATPKEIAACARELATILDLKRKYVRIDRGDKRQINQRIDDSLKPGGKLFLRLVQSGWTPPKPREVKKSEGWE